MDGEQYLWSNHILDRLQDLAFTKGFAVVILSGSQQKGRMRFGCVHHGKPRDTRKIDASDLGDPDIPIGKLIIIESEVQILRII